MSLLGGCCVCLASCAILICTVLIAFSEIALLVVSILAHLRYGPLSNLLDTVFIVTPILFIVVAVLRLLLGCYAYGCKLNAESDDDISSPSSGGCAENVLWALAIPYLVGGILLIMGRSNLDRLPVKLAHEFNATRSGAEAVKFIGELQQSEACCGLSSADDYASFGWPSELRQRYCCLDPPCLKKEFEKGCSKAVVETVDYYTAWFIAITIGLPAFLMGSFLVLALVAFCGRIWATVRDERDSASGPMLNLRMLNMNASAIENA